jgi:hypothetical protein
MTDRELEDSVLEDIRCHVENGVDLNPYSTPGMRLSWQRAFDGKPEMLLDYCVARRRGLMAARLFKVAEERATT